MGKKADVVIVGGGVIGLITAYDLAHAGGCVTVLERGEPGKQASWAGAGIIEPGNPAGATSPFDRLRAESVARFPSLAAELHKQTNIDIGYRHCGGYQHGIADDSESLRAWRREGIQIESVRGDPTSFYLPDYAQVRNLRYLRALATTVEQLGVSIVPNASVIGWHVVEDHILAARTEQDLYPAGEFLISGGAWSNQLLEQFGIAIPIEPVRGQMVLFRSNDATLRHIHIWGKRYLVPRGDGLVLAGSTEEDAGFDNRTTEAGISELRRFALAAWPALASATIETTWAGLRPGSVDGLPYLGRVPGVRNLSVAAGHFRAGIQNSPATGRLMAELLLGQTPFIPVESFRLDRPATRPAGPEFRS